MARRRVFSEYQQKYNIAQVKYQMNTFIAALRTAN